MSEEWVHRQSRPSDEINDILYNLLGDLSEHGIALRLVRSQGTVLNTSNPLLDPFPSDTCDLVLEDTSFREKKLQL